MTPSFVLSINTNMFDHITQGAYISSDGISGGVICVIIVKEHRSLQIGLHCYENGASAADLESSKPCVAFSWVMQKSPMPLECERCDYRALSFSRSIRSAISSPSTVLDTGHK